MTAPPAKSNMAGLLESSRVRLGFGVSGGLAALVAVAGGRADVALILLAVGMLPWLVVTGIRRPELLVTVFILVQPLKAFEVATPVTTISVGHILLAIIVLTNLPSIALVLRSSRVAQIAAALLVGWLLMYPLRAVHDPLSQVLRSTVTMSSFVLIAAAGLAIAPRPQALRALAIGSFGALMVLATAGVLVNLGVAPMTERYGAARELFGFTSPFIRTYGLNVPFDAVSLLVPLSVPYLSVRALDWSLTNYDRLRSILAVCLVGLASLLIFQGRGMLLEIAVSAAFAGVLALPGRYRGVAALALGVGLVVLAVRLINADQISSGLRGGIDLYAIQSVLADPARFVLGVSESALYLEGAKSVGLQDFAPADSVVHNFFLSALVGGGFAAFALITAFHGIGTWAAFMRWRVAPSLNSRTTLVAVTCALIGLSIEPARAGIVGSWLILGVAVGRGTKRPSDGRWRPREEDPTRRTSSSPSTLESPVLAPVDGGLERGSSRTAGGLHAPVRFAGQLPRGGAHATGSSRFAAARSRPPDQCDIRMQSAR